MLVPTKNLSEGFFGVDVQVCAAFHVVWCRLLQLQNQAPCVVAQVAWECACQLAVFDARRAAYAYACADRFPVTGCIFGVDV